MKALWIRVEAHQIDSLEIARLAELLDVDVVTAFGHYCALGGAIAEHSPEGQIADVPDAALERWGRWTGKRGRFAPAIRKVFETDDGEFADWVESMGKLIERREKERARKFRGNSAEIPRHKNGNSGATERNGTERNGSSSSTQKTPIGGAEAATAAAPPLDASAETATATFMAAYYATASDKRRRDVWQQLQACQGTIGAKLEKGVFVRAGSPQRLVVKIRELMLEGVIDRDKAIRVLLLKLGDTSDGSAPGVAAAADEQRSTERDERATASELAAATEWVRECPKIKQEIEREISADFGAETWIDELNRLERENPMLAKGIRMSWNAKLLTAWRNAGSPNSELTHVDSG